MPLKQPESVDECVYFTRRTIDKGHVMCWTFKEKCPKCGKALMSKPKGEDGKVKIRAKEYVCPSCGNSAEKKAYEETLTANAIYTCPHCKKQGESQVPFKRKKVKGVEMVVFSCQHCGGKIEVTKKMANKKEE